MSTSLIKQIIATAKRENGKPAFIYFQDKEQNTLTYNDFLKLTYAFYTAIKSKPRTASKLVILVGENSPKWPAAYLGAHMNGLTVAHGDSRYTDPEFKTIEQFTEPSLILCERKFSDFFSQNIEKIYLEDIDESFRESVPNEPDVIPLSSDQPMSIIFTSGTTGDPKGVMLSESNFMSNIKMFDTLDDIVTRDDRTVAILPFHHVYPFTCTILVPLRLGATLILPRSLKGEDIFGAIKAFDATILLAVPRVLELFYEKISKNIEALPFPQKAVFSSLLYLSAKLKSLGFDYSKKIFGQIHKNLPSLRFFACGGAKLDEATHRSLKDLGFTIVEAYGLTETSPISAINTLTNPVPGSVGKPAPGIEVKIEKTDPLKHDGEILIKGRNVMMGYYKKPDATNQVIEDGWFHTGDLGYFDSGGHLFITGRKKEMIVLSTGKNIYPEELEKFYKQTKKIQELCITLLKKGKKEVLTAVVYPNKEHFSQIKLPNIYQDIKFDIETLAQKLPPHQRIQDIVIVNEDLPKTALGKLKRHIVLTALNEKDAATAKPERSNDDLREPFLEMVQHLLGLETTPELESNLETDLGLDSLAKLEFFSMIEQKFNVKIGDEVAGTIITLKDVQGFIGNAMGSDTQLERHSLEKLVQLPPKIPLAKHVSVTDKQLDTVLRFLFHLVCKTLFKLLFNVQVGGKEILATLSPPFIIAPNHKSFIDALIIYGFFPFRIVNSCYFVGLLEYFEKFPLNIIQRMGRVVLTGTRSTTISSLQYAHEILKSGKPMCIFPEGKRSIDINVEEPKKGVGHVAKLTNAPLLPVYLGGTEKLYSRQAPGFHLASLKMHILPPVHPNGGSNGELNGRAELILKSWQKSIQDHIDTLKGK